GIALCAWWMGLHGAIIALSTTALLRCLLHNIWFRAELRRHGLNLRCDKVGQETELLFKFALPAALSGYISMPALWFGNALLVRQAGGYEQMALYSAASSFRIIVIILPTVMSNVCLSVLNHQ